MRYNGEDHMFIQDDDLVLVYRGEEVSTMVGYDLWRASAPVHDFVKFVSIRTKCLRE